MEKYQEVPQVNTTFTQTACLNPILTVSGCGTCCTNGGTTLNLGANQVATFVPNIPVASVLTLQFKIQWPASADMSLRTVTYTTANGQTPIPVANFTKGDEYAFVTISKDIAPINLAVQFGVAGAVLKDISYSTTSGTYLVNDKMKDLLPEIICNQEDKTGKYFYTSTTGTCSLTEVNGNLEITPTSGNQESLARWYNGFEVGKSYTFVARVPLGTHFGQGRPVIRVTDFNGRGITLQANTGLMPFNNGNHTVAQASRHPDGNEWVYWLRFPATTTSVKLEYLGAIQGVNEGQTLTSLQLLQTLPEAEYGGASNYRYGFNGKEKENTLYNSSNAYDFGARLYDSRIGRWFGVDPLRFEYPSWSNYASFGNNPYRNIDIDGKKFLNFDKDGNYMNTTYDTWWHNLFFGIIGRINDEKGEEVRRFRFSDPENDAEYIEKNDKFKRICVVSEEQIFDLLLNAGVFNSENKTENNPVESRYEYIYKHGKSLGRLDFSCTQLRMNYPENDIAATPTVNRPVFFLVDNDIAYNHFNFGNFLFGAAGNALGYSKDELTFGAHWNSLFNENGYSRQLDSVDDQDAISDGAYYSLFRSYSDISISIKIGPVESKKNEESSKRK